MTPEAMRRGWAKVPLFFNYCPNCGEALDGQCDWCWYGGLNDDPPCTDDGFDPVALVWYERWER